MQFRHPEFLYALFALVIPIIVHLFQLRRFQKVPFTNVQFLKAVTIQTRKSSQIKKWLTLLARLLAFAALIIAFAQPFLAAEEIVGKKSETVIYLDNSFSMQAKGPKGPLLQRAVQELLSSLPDDEVISIFTNTETFKEVTKKDIRNDLLQLEYTSNQISYSAAYLKGKQLLGNSPETIKRIIMVSDFQQKDEAFDIPADVETKTNLIKLVPVTRQNIAIDSLSLRRDENNEMALNVLLSNTDAKADNISVAFYNEEKLIAKTSTSIPKDSKTSIQFKIDENTKINGRIVIEDPSLTFDNYRYFTINTPEKIKVVAINEASDNFIKNIYTPDEFLLISAKIDELNYNDIGNANLVLINEIKQIPISLINALKSFKDQGGSICFIPATDGNLISYQQFINNFSSESLVTHSPQEKKITGINFSHPLYRGVFDKTITNFQYPKVNSYYQTSASNTILSFEDSNPFLYLTNTMYIFTASINNENSNFKNSPLIVPTLYNIGKQSLKLSNISYNIGQSNTYDVPISLGQDGILSLESDVESSIPLQQSFATKVRITTDEVPSKAGIYALKDKEKLIQHVSYNYNTLESDLQYYNLSSTKEYEVNDSVTTLFEQIKEETSIDELWKWFIIFALIFLLIEILLLKYLK
ncbi:N-terminal double-transmembrane domain-containing protein [Aquimarina amphilecti]|uniref:N-terminal double-transmembrane domain-containing protein n=1 Tax=Aquimarina amphilecti TaxID=1038014 RepID=A0A1H7I7L6_AQUAM|nr:BatA and WFA domain-containing protein [Aquimarina amphilecti]SEK58553.1 N-terminal double-transmembrane domain-containing protein [Aquimarina amphilecti]